MTLVLIRRHHTSGSEAKEFSPTATMELPDICVAQESSALREFLRAASCVSQNVQSTVLIGHINESVVQDREGPHPHIRAVPESLYDLCSRPRHENPDLERQSRIRHIPGA